MQQCHDANKSGGPILTLATPVAMLHSALRATVSFSTQPSSTDQSASLPALCLPSAHGPLCHWHVLDGLADATLCTNDLVCVHTAHSEATVGQWHVVGRRFESKHRADAIDAGEDNDLTKPDIIQPDEAEW